MKARRKDEYRGVTYKTYKLNDGKVFIVQYGRDGRPAAWHVHGKKTRITTEAARILLYKIIRSGTLLAQKKRTFQDIRPIPQCTPYSVMRELLSGASEVKISP